MDSENAETVGPDHELFNTWVNKNYGGNTRTKTITREKYIRICKLIRGEDPECNAKFRFWARNKGFQLMKFNTETNEIASDSTGDLYVSLHAKEENHVPGEGSIESFLRTNLPAISFYRKVAVVDEFYGIIKSAHVDQKGLHAGQKKTYRLVSDTYAFLPREVITFYLLNCDTCKPRIQKYGPIPKSRANKLTADRKPQEKKTNSKTERSLQVDDRSPFPDQLQRPYTESSNSVHLQRPYVEQKKHHDAIDEHPPVHILDDTGAIAELKLDMINKNFKSKEMLELQRREQSFDFHHRQHKSQATVKHYLPEQRYPTDHFRQNPTIPSRHSSISRYRPYDYSPSEKYENDRRMFSHLASSTSKDMAISPRNGEEDYIYLEMKRREQMRHAYHQSYSRHALQSRDVESFSHRIMGPRDNRELIYEEKYRHGSVSHNSLNTSKESQNKIYYLEDGHSVERSGRPWEIPKIFNLPRRDQSPFKRIPNSAFKRIPTKMERRDSQSTGSSHDSGGSCESLPGSPNDRSHTTDPHAIDSSVAEFHEMVFEQVKSSIRNIPRFDGDIIDHIKVPTQASIMRLMNNYETYSDEAASYDLTDDEDEDVVVA